MNQIASFCQRQRHSSCGRRLQHTPNRPAYAAVQPKQITPPPCSTAVQTWLMEKARHDVHHIHVLASSTAQNIPKRFSMENSPTQKLLITLRAPRRHAKGVGLLRGAPKGELAVRLGQHLIAMQGHKVVRAPQQLGEMRRRPRRRLLPTIPTVLVVVLRVVVVVARLVLRRHGLHEHDWRRLQRGHRRPAQRLVSKALRGGGPPYVARRGRVVAAAARRRCRCPAGAARCARFAAPAGGCGGAAPAGGGAAGGPPAGAEGGVGRGAHWRRERRRRPAAGGAGRRERRR